MPVRNRHETNQAAFTEAELQSALQIIREGKATVYKAAKDCGINKIILYRYISAGLGTTTSELKKKTKKRQWHYRLKNNNKNNNNNKK